MPISRTGKLKVKLARTRRGNCYLCHKPVIPGEKYVECVGGSITKTGHFAHFDCYK